MSRGWAAVSVVLAAVLAVMSGLAVGAVPASWKWAHNGGVLWGITGGVAVASVVIGVLQSAVLGRRRGAGRPGTGNSGAGGGVGLRWSGRIPGR